jgi:hypothetical protein
MNHAATFLVATRANETHCDSGMWRSGLEDLAFMVAPAINDNLALERPWLDTCAISITLRSVCK